MKMMYRINPYVATGLFALISFFAGNVTHALTIKELIRNQVLSLVNPIIVVLSGAAIIAFIWGIVKFIWNADNESEREKGKVGILWGIIGLFLLFSFWGFVLILQKSVFGDSAPPLPFTF